MPVRNPITPPPTTPVQPSNVYSMPRRIWTSRDQRGQLYCGDCLEILPCLPAGSVDLIFNDPPFNIGKEYDEYDDNRADQEYLAWTAKWLKECRRVIAPKGSIYVAIGPRLQAEVKILMDRAGFTWRSSVVWYYSFGTHQRRNWTPSWTMLHYATAHKNHFTWNLDAIRVPSARQLKYNDKRAKAGGKTPDNVWMLLPTEYREEINERGEDLLIESRIAGTFKDRAGHVCQMNQNVLDRVIAASSSLGETVLDPMCGAATTGVSALSLGRKFIGVELSENYCKEYAVPRLKKVVGE